MPEYIVFPDLETALIAYLAPLLEVPVGNRVPDPRPRRFVKLERTGGIETSLTIEQVNVNVEAWADTAVDAYNLARRARAALRHVHQITGGTVLRVEPYSTPANLPDPTTNQARYTALYAIRVRGTGTTTL